MVKTKKISKHFCIIHNPKTSFDVYIDKNPNDTILKYTTVEDVKNTIKIGKAQNKQYSHKRT